MSKALDALIEEYRILRRKKGVEHLELVKQEHRIWDQLKLDRGRGFTRTAAGERRDWFYAQFNVEFGGNVSDYESRASIFNAGPWAHVVFQRVDQGFMKMSTAVRLVREAKFTARLHQIDHSIALERALRAQNGIETSDPASTLPPLEVDTSFDKGPNANSKTFTTRINALAGAYVEAAFAEFYIDGHHKRKIIADFKDSVDLLIEDLKRAINRTKFNTRDEGIQEVGAINFAWACEVLGFSYSFGQAINLRTVKSRKNKRSLELHPDRNPGNKAAEEEFDRVQRAYSLLVQYSEKNNRRATNGEN